MLCYNTQHIFFPFHYPWRAPRPTLPKAAQQKSRSCFATANPGRTTAINGCIYQRLSFTLQDVMCSFSQLHHRRHFLKTFFRCFFSPPPSPVQFAQELRNKVWPSFRQAGGRLHPLGCLDFVPTNCHVNFMQVSYPKSTTSAGRTFSIRFGRKNSLFGLDPDQG